MLKEASIRLRRKVYMSDLMNKFGGRQDVAADLVEIVIRRERIHHGIINRVRISLVEVLSKRDCRRNQFTVLVPLERISAGAVLSLFGHDDRQEELFVVCVVVPLRAPELGGKQFFFPLCVPLFDRLRDDLADSDTRALSLCGTRFAGKLRMVVTNENWRGAVEMDMHRRRMRGGQQCQ